MIVQKMKFYAFIFPFLCLQINFYFTLQVAVEELLTYTRVPYNKAGFIQDKRNIVSNVVSHNKNGLFYMGTKIRS